jgi:hypothetical protein
MRDLNVRRQPDELGDLKPDLGCVLDHSQDGVAPHRANDAIVVRLRHVIPRGIIHDGELAEDVARVEQGEDDVAIVGSRHGNLDDPAFQQENLVTRIARQVNARSALDLEHPGQLLELMPLRGAQGGNHPKPLEVPEFGVCRHLPVVYTEGDLEGRFGHARTSQPTNSA